MGETAGSSEREITAALKGLVFADIEASGLQYLSYPIEVDWAWVEGTHVEARSILIKPTNEWLNWQTGWSEDVEQVHGISREQLLAVGFEPSEACERLNLELQEAEIAFDTGQWLALRLIADMGVQSPDEVADIISSITVEYRSRF